MLCKKRVNRFLDFNAYSLQKNIDRIFFKLKTRFNSNIFMRVKIRFV